MTIDSLHRMTDALRIDIRTMGMGYLLNDDETPERLLTSIAVFIQNQVSSDDHHISFELETHLRRTLDRIADSTYDRKLGLIQAEITLCAMADLVLNKSRTAIIHLLASAIVCETGACNKPLPDVY